MSAKDRNDRDARRMRPTGDGSRTRRVRPMPKDRPHEKPKAERKTALARDPLARSRALRDYYARHRGGTGAVVLAHVFDADGTEIRAVFSCYERARDWAESIDVSDESTIHFVPYVVDEPEYGALPPSEIH